MRLSDVIRHKVDEQEIIRGVLHVSGIQKGGLHPWVCVYVRREQGTVSTDVDVLRSPWEGRGRK